eukprot:UN26039
MHLFRGVIKILKFFSKSEIEINDLKPLPNNLFHEKEMCADAFKSMDTNGDGFIQYNVRFFKIPNEMLFFRNLKNYSLIWSFLKAKKQQNTSSI